MDKYEPASNSDEEEENKDNVVIISSITPMRGTELEAIRPKMEGEGSITKPMISPPTEEEATPVTTEEWRIASRHALKPSEGPQKNYLTLEELGPPEELMGS